MGVSWRVRHIILWHNFKANHPSSHTYLALVHILPPPFLSFADIWHLLAAVVCSVLAVRTVSLPQYLYWILHCCGLQCSLISRIGLPPCFSLGFWVFDPFETIHTGVWSGYNLIYIRGRVPVAIAFVLHDYFLMMKPLCLLFFIFGLLTLPLLLITLHSLLQPCIIKFLLFLPIVVPPMTIINIMIFIKPLLLSISLLLPVTLREDCSCGL